MPHAFRSAWARSPQTAWALILSALCASLLMPAVARAQAVRGRVLDDSTGTAIGQVSLTLLDSAGVAVGSTITGDNGAFILPAPDSGRYRLHADRLGYTSVMTESFAINHRDTTGVLIHMGVGAVPLAPLTVVGYRKRSRMRGRDRFAADEALGRGVFITPQQIEAMHPRLTTGVLTNVPGVWLARRGFIVTPRSEWWGCMHVVVNGLPFRNFNGEGIDGDVLPGDLKAMEVYRSMSEVPPREQQWVAPTSDKLLAECGLLVIWTKAAW